MFNALKIMFYAFCIVTDVSTAADVWNPNNNNKKDFIAGGAQENQLSVGGKQKQPQFDLSMPLNITVQYGAHVHLACRVLDVSNKSVFFARRLSWPYFARIA